MTRNRRAGWLLNPAGSALPLADQKLSLARTIGKLGSKPALVKSFLALNALLYVLVAVHLPIHFFPRGIHDDGLFMGHAKTIMEGHWLGPYSQFTLMKGPGYSIFLAIAHVIGVSAVLAEALLYCASVGYLALAVWKYSRSRFFALGIFFVTLWNFGPDTSRIIRDSIVTPLFLFMLAGLILGLLTDDRRSRIHLIIAGFAFGFFWITREDAFLLALTVAMLFLAGFIRDRLAASTGLRGHVWSRALLSPAILVLGVGFAVVAMPSAVNYVKYRQFGVVDINGNFERAMEALQSIRSGPLVPYVPVPRSSRDLAYQVSPTFAQLEGPLDDPSSPLQGWKPTGCAELPQTCGEYGGGWFLWALRDAVAMRGGYKNGRTSSAFYRSIHDEIRAACAAKRINCYRTVIPFMPPVSRQQLGAIPAAVARAVAKLSFYDRPAPREPGFLGTRDAFWEYGSFLNLDIQPPPAEGQPAPRSRDNSVLIAVKVYNGLLGVYHYTMPLLIGLGLLGFLVLTFRTIHHPSRLSAYVFVLGLWLTVAARVLLLALVDISSFPAIKNLYLSYTFPLVAFASALSIYLNFTLSKVVLEGDRPAVDQGVVTADFSPQRQVVA